MRVTPQLVRVDNDTQVWADTYDRRLDEIFTVQSDIASRVIEELGTAVLGPERRALETRPTENLQAYDAYLRGSYLFHRARQDDRLEALRFFEQSVALDPTFAKGHAAVANAAAWRFFYVEPTREWEARADAAIEKALALDPNLADAYLARGNLLWTQPRGFPHERAIRDLRRAQALNPNSAEDAGGTWDALYNHVGLLDEARDELTAALALDPANEEAPGRLIQTLEFEHDFTRAMAENQRHSRPSDWATVEALSRLGRDNEAAALAARLLPGPWVPGAADLASSRHFRIVLMARLGESARVDALLPGLEAVAGNPQGLSHLHHFQYSLALAHAVRGRKREAVAWLRRSAAEGFPCYPYFAKDPNLANLSGDPDFESLMAKLKAQWEQLKKAAHS